MYALGHKGGYRHFENESVNRVLEGAKTFSIVCQM